MSTSFKVQVFCLAIFSLIGLGYSIKCYQCNSGVDPDCAALTVNDTSSKHYKECTGDYEGESPFCRIYVTNVLHIQEPEKAVRILRSCGWIRNKTLPQQESCRNDNSDFILKTKCQCFKDGCNSSHHWEPSKLLMVLFLILPILW
ncbi:unnamed protein product [Phyllotreta striolata]|uniref:Protein sleepless n=1 Tax=Phyllotreta striolata TaxID=444603 RepID=A0A9N9TVK4_PHYSR|nr:unnamed protein product [Phyllotreta striolata]